MIRPTEKVYKALLNISHNSDWVIIREWINGSITENLILSAKTDDDISSKRMQGAALELMEIIENQDISFKKLELINGGKIK